MPAFSNLANESAIQMTEIDRKTLLIYLQDCYCDVKIIPRDRQLNDLLLKKTVEIVKYSPTCVTCILLS